MGTVIEGVGGQRWMAPEWVARNAVFFLLPYLEANVLAQALLERLRTIVDERAPMVQLSDLLTQPTLAMLWVEAIIHAEDAIANEDPQAWNDPSAYEPFLAHFRNLRLLPMSPTSPQREP